jgi:hypothetical protein
MPDSITRKTPTAREAHNSPHEKTYEVWVDIEEYDQLTDCYTECDAPGGALATFDTCEEAYEFAQQIDSAYSNYTQPSNAIKPFTVVGFWTDNEQGFVESVMAASADSASELARKAIASRNNCDSAAAEHSQWSDECIRIIGACKVFCVSCSGERYLLVCWVVMRLGNMMAK